MATPTSTTPTTATATQAATTPLSALSTAPTDEELSRLDLKPASNLVASADALSAIAADWASLKVPTAQLMRHALDLVNFCFDSGSSKYTTVEGSSPTPTIPRATLAGVVRKHTTLRQFCRYYAKIIWNARVKANIPPAGYANAHIKPEQAFAGFDFFDGVMNVAALEPSGGLVREPTPQEIIAAETARSLNLFEAQSKGNNLATNATQVTRGRLSSSEPQVQFLTGVDE